LIEASLKFNYLVLDVFVYLYLTKRIFELQTDSSDDENVENQKT